MRLEFNGFWSTQYVMLFSRNYSIIVIRIFMQGVEKGSSFWDLLGLSEKNKKCVINVDCRINSYATKNKI